MTLGPLTSRLVLVGRPGQADLEAASQECPGWAVIAGYIQLKGMIRRIEIDHSTVCEVRCFSGRHHDSLDLYQSIVWANASGQALRVARQPSLLCIFDESIA